MVTIDQLNNHIQNEIQSVIANHGIQPNGAIQTIKFELAYTDILKTFPTQNFSTVFQIPIVVGVCLSEFTVVPIRAIPKRDAFISYYGATPEQLAQLENEGLVQTLLADQPNFYHTCEWFSDFVNARFGGLPPIERMGAFTYIADQEFRERLAAEDTMAHIHKLGPYFEDDAITKLCLMRRFVAEAPFERFLNILRDRKRYTADLKRTLIDVAFYTTVGLTFHGLGGIPHFNAEFLRLAPMFESFRKGEDLPDYSFNVFQQTLWKALPLRMPQKIEHVPDLVRLHADGIPKMVGEALAALSTEISQDNPDEATIEKLVSQAQTKIKDANKEFLRLCRSWKARTVDALLDAGDSLSPIGIPLKDKIKDYFTRRMIRGSEFTRKWVALKWQFKNREK